MTLQEAFNNLRNVARAFQGNADAHDALRESLRIIEEKIFTPVLSESSTDNVETFTSIIRK